VLLGNREGNRLGAGAFLDPLLTSADWGSSPIAQIHFCADRLPGLLVRRFYRDVTVYPWLS
jgi:hypothetical protein